MIVNRHAPMIDQLAAYHVGREIPADGILHAGGTKDWKVTSSQTNTHVKIDVPQIFSFATAGWVIPFDTCARWNASPVTMIFPLRQILQSTMASVGPELMFLDSLPIPMMLVNRDLIPEDHDLIQKNKDKVRFLFYSGGTEETSLKLRREKANELMDAEGLKHFEPIDIRYPIPSYNMRFKIDGKTTNYFDIFRRYLFPRPVSFGWELHSIQGGADLFYRIKCILMRKFPLQAASLTAYNIRNLKKRFISYLKQLAPKANTREKIEKVLKETEEAIRKLEGKKPNFLDPELLETLLYQWFETFKNMPIEEFLTYQLEFFDQFALECSSALRKTILLQMNHVYKTVKHIERNSPYLEKQLQGVIALNAGGASHYYEHYGFSVSLWEEIFKYYFCAPLDNEKITQEDIEEIKREIHTVQPNGQSTMRPNQWESFGWKKNSERPPFSEKLSKSFKKLIENFYSWEHRTTPLGIMARYAIEEAKMAKDFETALAQHPLVQNIRYFVTGLDLTDILVTPPQVAAICAFFPKIISIKFGTYKGRFNIGEHLEAIVEAKPAELNDISAFNTQYDWRKHPALLKSLPSSPHLNAWDSKGLFGGA